jgi:hypothetical protein
MVVVGQGVDEQDYARERIALGSSPGVYPLASA